MAQRKRKRRQDGKLSDVDRRAIAVEYLLGKVGQKVLAARYNITQAAVSQIVRAYKKPKVAVVVQQPQPPRPKATMRHAKASANKFMPDGLNTLQWAQEYAAECGLDTKDLIIILLEKERRKYGLEARDEIDDLLSGQES